MINEIKRIRFQMEIPSATSLKKNFSIQGSERFFFGVQMIKLEKGIWNGGVVGYPVFALTSSRLLGSKKPFLL